MIPYCNGEIVCGANDNMALLNVDGAYVCYNSSLEGILSLTHLSCHLCAIQ